MADTDDDDGTGLSIHAVVSGLKKQGISEADVKNAIDFLANEGHLYSTILWTEIYKATAASGLVRPGGQAPGLEAQLPGSIPPSGVRFPLHHPLEYNLESLFAVHVHSLFQ